MAYDPTTKRPLSEAELEAEILSTNRDTKSGTVYAGSYERAREELNGLAPDVQSGDKNKV